MQDTNTPTRSPQPSFSGKLMPRKPKSDAVRPRKHLTPGEVELLLKAARQTGRYGHRDYTLLLIMYRHGLRVSEAVSLQWSQIQFDQGTIFVKRKKNGIDTTQPLTGKELRALRRLQRESSTSPYVFMTERKTILTTSGVRKIIARAGKKAEIPFPVNPHALRHSTGYKLVNQGEDTRSVQVYLGHRNINHTATYTALSATRFQGMWED